MKTETDHSQEFLQFIRERTGFTAFKHCDRFTTGIPDCSVSKRPNRTVWVESKRLAPRGDRRAKRTSIDVLNPRSWIDNQVQMDTLVRLGGWYLVFDTYASRYFFVRGETAYRCYTRGELIDPSHGILSTDRTNFFGQVLITLTKELEA